MRFGIAVVQLYRFPRHVMRLRKRLRGRFAPCKEHVPNVAGSFHTLKFSFREGAWIGQRMESDQEEMDAEFRVRISIFPAARRGMLSCPQYGENKWRLVGFWPGSGEDILSSVLLLFSVHVGCYENIMNSNEALTPQRIMAFAWGYAPTLAIDAAVRHGIFDALDKTPQTVEQLAANTGASVRGLRAILNLLVSLDLLARQDERYALTPESSAFLVSSKPGYHGMVFNHISNQLLPRWQQLTEIVRTGQPAIKVNEQTEGAVFFAEFVESLFPISSAAAAALGEHLGIPRALTPISVLDIGAGSGVWGITLAKQSSRVRIRAVDWPQVLAITKKVATQHGVAERLTTAPGDFTEADFGSEHQIATVGHILHSEGPERSRHLLKKVFDALAPGGTVAIQEFVPNDDRTGPPHTLIFAVNMLVNTQFGDTFTFAEMSGWLRDAGYLNPRILDVPSVSPLILADKPRVARLKHRAGRLACMTRTHRAFRSHTPHARWR